MCVCVCVASLLATMRYRSMQADFQLVLQRLANSSQVHIAIHGDNSLHHLKQPKWVVVCDTHRVRHAPHCIERVGSKPPVHWGPCCRWQPSDSRHRLAFPFQSCPTRNCWRWQAFRLAPQSWQTPCPFLLKSHRTSACARYSSAAHLPQSQGSCGVCAQSPGQRPDAPRFCKTEESKCRCKTG